MLNYKGEDAEFGRGEMEKISYNSLTKAATMIIPAATIDPKRIVRRISSSLRSRCKSMISCFVARRSSISLDCASAKASACCSVKPDSLSFFTNEWVSKVVDAIFNLLQILYHKGEMIDNNKLLIMNYE